MQNWRKRCLEGQRQDASFPYHGYDLKHNGMILKTMIDALEYSPNGPEKGLQLVAEAMAAGQAKLTVHQVGSGKGVVAARKIHEILFMMKESNINPNKRTNRQLLLAWAQAEVDGCGYAAEQADELLRHMIHLYREGEGPKPDTKCFNSCMKAWLNAQKRSDAPDRVEILFDLLVRLYEETSDPELKPDVARETVLSQPGLRRPIVLTPWKEL